VAADPQGALRILVHRLDVIGGESLLRGKPGQLPIAPAVQPGRAPEPQRPAAIAMDDVHPAIDPRGEIDLGPQVAVEYARYTRAVEADTQRAVVVFEERPDLRCLGVV